MVSMLPFSGQAIFQSTCPARGTTHCRRLSDAVRAISIHVPREGHDLQCVKMCAILFVFQSTCPARGTTRQRRAVRQEQLDISIHVPREGHDLSPCVVAASAGIISIHVPREGHDRRFL